MSTSSPYSNLPPGSGPDGGTLLGFLASIGALVVFTRIYPSKKITLHWEQSLGWRARLLIDMEQLTTEHLTSLHGFLIDGRNRNRFTLCKRLGGERYKTISKLELSDATRFLTEAIKSNPAHERNDLCSSYGGWFSDQPDEKEASATKLCALTGGSQQNFLETALDLSGFHKNEKREQRSTTVENLRETLLSPWSYKDPMPGCRWEAQEDRHYALRHRNPTKHHRGEGQETYDGLVRTQRGANRLGIEALSIFPLMPKRVRAETPGFRFDRECGYQFTWAIWDCPLTLDAVRLLVAHPELVEGKPNMHELRSLGIRALFRSTRITKGKGQVSFTIARPL